MKRPFLKIGDYLIILAVAGLIVFLFADSLGARGGETLLKVTSPGSVQYYDFDQNRELLVEGPLGATEVVIQDGQAWIHDSPCRDKICVAMGRIRHAGQQAVCLPNRVIIEVSGQGRQVDGVSR
jgi:hypothetical protein